MKSLSRGSRSPFLDDSCFYIAPIDSHGNLVVKVWNWKYHAVAGIHTVYYRVRQETGFHIAVCYVIIINYLPRNHIKGLTLTNFKYIFPQSVS